MDYTGKFKISIGVSATIIIIGIVAGVFTGALNVGVDFAGGALFTIETHDPNFDMDVVNAALESNGITDAQVVRTGNTTSAQSMVNITMRSLNDDEAESAVRTDTLNAIKQTYPRAAIITVDRVDGVASAGLVRNAILSVLAASVLILCYIWIRFELFSGLAAVLCLLHDVAIMFAFTCILRVPINSPFIAAILTIVGYSINNTIVVFDRIRENRKSDVHADKHFDMIVNQSVQATLGRSINTSFTTLITITMVYIFGVSSIKEFSLPIIIGLLAGTYSSIFLAGPLWAKWLQARMIKAKGKTLQKGKKKASAKK
ncbi:MAG: protein translocase subunit SecF [Clostridiales bacterium]|jgi:preprotein translocase subunit SecF|nr:protein translocase subunit SecF [Clostridiales bacterium]